jgi:hypothetical protein
MNVYGDDARWCTNCTRRRRRGHRLRRSYRRAARQHLRTQNVTVLTTTSPLLQALARDDDLVDVINEKGLQIEGRCPPG